MEVGLPFIAVRIDKAAQKQKMSKEGSIWIPPQFAHMARYLQYGQIVAIGAVAGKQFPEMEIGDMALFTHYIEDGDERILEVLPNGDEIRYIDGSNLAMNYEIFGIIKDGNLIPAKQFLFADTRVLVLRSPIHSSLQVTDTDQWDNEEYIRERLGKIEFEEQQLAKSLPDNNNPMIVFSMEERRRFAEVENAIISKREERAAISRYINRKKFISARVLHGHPETLAATGAFEGGRVVLNQKTVYPFEVEGNRFLLIDRNFIEMVVTQE